MAVRILVAGILLLLPAIAGAQQAAPTSPQDPSFKAYDAIIEQYESGDFDGAVSQLAAWPMARLKSELRPAEIIVDARYLRAKVMLHTEVMLAGVLLEAHFASARVSMQVLLARGLCSEEFVAKWVALIGNILLLHDKVRFFTRSTVLEETKAWDSDAGVLLIRGSIAESMWTSGHAYVNGTMSVGGVVITRRPDEARTNYQKALKINPGLVEARLRLGRVLFLSGDRDAARRELELARAEAREPYLVYLSTLFLGQVYEQNKMFNEAGACYESCIRLFPDGQTAFLALGHLREITGQPDSAWTTVRGMFGDKQKTKNPSADPYWAYSCGQLWKMAANIEGLRAEVK